jgi:NAD(P)H-hydrate repair Nnr-like enzyme with NAD(P)H-hydrate epimerase domain
MHPGMVEAGQHITDTRTREFGEEALAMMDAGDEAGRKVREGLGRRSAEQSFSLCFGPGGDAGDAQAVEERLARVFGAEPEPEDFL